MSPAALRGSAGWLSSVGSAMNPSSWIDATSDGNADGDAEAADVARTLGAPDAAIRWLAYPARISAPCVGRGVLHFGLTSSSDRSTDPERFDLVTLSSSEATAR